MVGRQGHFVTTARGGTVYDAHIALAGMLRGILDGIPGFIGEFAKIHFVGMARYSQHGDVGARAEHPLLGRSQHHGLDLLVLEAQTLDGVVELDIDTQIIGIELQGIARHQPGVFIHIHSQSCHRAVKGNLPVVIFVGMGRKIYHMAIIISYV